jgi:hypothetical protein
MNVAAGFRDAAQTVGTGLSRAPVLVRAQGQHKVHGMSIAMGGVTTACVYYLQTTLVPGESGYEQEDPLLDARNALIAGAAGTLLAYAGLTATAWAFRHKGPPPVQNEARSGNDPLDRFEHVRDAQGQGTPEMVGHAANTDDPLQWTQLDPMASPDGMARRARTIMGKMTNAMARRVHPEFLRVLREVAGRRLDRSSKGGLAVSGQVEHDTAAIVSPTCVCIGAPVHWGDVLAAELVGGYTSPIPRMRQNEISIMLGGANPQVTLDWYRLSRGLQIELVRSCMIWAPRHSALSQGMEPEFFYYLRAGSQDARSTARTMARGAYTMYKDEEERRYIINMIPVMGSETGWFNLSKRDQEWLRKTWNVHEPNLQTTDVIMDARDPGSMRTGLNQLLSRINMVFSSYENPEGELYTLMKTHDITTRTLNKVLVDDNLEATINFIILNVDGLRAIGKYIEMNVQLENLRNNDSVREQCMDSPLKKIEPPVTPSEVMRWLLHEHVRTMSLGDARGKTMEAVIGLLERTESSAHLCSKNIIVPVINQEIIEISDGMARRPVTRTLQPDEVTRGPFRYSNGLGFGLDYAIVRGLGSKNLSNYLQVRVAMATDSPDTSVVVQCSLSPAELHDILGSFPERRFPLELHAPGHRAKDSPDVHTFALAVESQQKATIEGVLKLMCHCLQVHWSLCTVTPNVELTKDMEIRYVHCGNVHPTVATMLYDLLTAREIDHNEAFDKIKRESLVTDMTAADGTLKETDDKKPGIDATKQAHQELHAYADALREPLPVSVEGGQDTDDGGY